MKGLLAIFVHYFCWQRTMAWTSGIGIAFIVLGLVLPPPADLILILFGAIIGLGFPIMFAGVAFRCLVAHKRIALVPEFRIWASAALLLLAVAGSGIGVLFADTVNDIAANRPPVELFDAALLCFWVISIYLLLSQWLVIHSLGLLAFFVLPLFLIRVGMFGDPIVRTQLAEPWPFIALALLGWAWLFHAMHRPGLAKAIAAPSWGSGLVPQGDNRSTADLWIPQWGPEATAGGTLMRGVRDGWGSRIFAAVVFVLTFPLVLLVLHFVISAIVDESRQIGFSAGYFLFASLFGVTFQPSLAFSEWPARLRYLWLRQRGNRAMGWQFIERNLIRDVLIIGAVATLVAIGFAVFSSIEFIFLAFYIAAGVLLAALGYYLRFWIRALNWHEIVYVLFVISLIIACVCVFAFLNNRETPERIVWSLPIFAVVALIFRALAKRATLNIDWCAVRPFRAARGMQRNA